MMESAFGPSGGRYAPKVVARFRHRRTGLSGRYGVRAGLPCEVAASPDPLLRWAAGASRQQVLALAATGHAASGAVCGATDGDHTEAYTVARPKAVLAGAAAQTGGRFRRNRLIAFLGDVGLPCFGAADQDGQGDGDNQRPAVE